MKRLLLFFGILLAVAIGALLSPVVENPSVLAQTNTFCASNLTCTVSAAWTFSSNLNGTCLVSATQTLQQCINLFSSGNADIFVPAGTWSSASAVTISGNGQSGIHIKCAGGNASTISYTGAGAIAAVLDIGTSSPTVNLLNRIVIDGCVIRGNANATHAIRLQGVNTSMLMDVDGRDVTGSALQWLFGVGNKIIGWSTTTNDGIGSFSPTPTGCMELSELAANNGVSTTSVVTPRCENVSGTAVLIKNGFDMSFSGCQISSNGTALDLEPSAFTPFPNTLQSNFNGCLFENSSNADGVIINGLQTAFHQSQLATTGTGKVHIKSLGGNSLIESSQVGTPGITIDSGVLNTHLRQVNMAPANLIDNGSNTQLTNNFNPNTGKQWVGGYGTNPGWASTMRQVIPSFSTGDGLIGGGGYDPLDHPNQGCWDFGTSAVIISHTPLTTGKPWRALFIGMWENNTDGAGLAQLPTLLEVTSVANTLAVGTVTLTFSVNGSGFFQGISGASNASFCGTIYVNPNPTAAAGTNSLLLKGNISAPLYTSTAAGSSVDFNVVSTNAFRSNSAGGSYFLDIGNVTFRDGNGSPGGSVTLTGAEAFSETTAPAAGATKDVCYGDSTLHAVKCSYNNGTFFQIPQVITATSAAFATATTAGTCVQNTTAVTGAATTMAVSASPVSTPGVGAVWSAFVSSAGNVTINECAVATSAGGTIAFNIRVTP